MPLLRWIVGFKSMLQQAVFLAGKTSLIAGTIVSHWLRKLWKSIVIVVVDIAWALREVESWSLSLELRRPRDLN